MSSLTPLHNTVFTSIFIYHIDLHICVQNSKKYTLYPVTVIKLVKLMVHTDYSPNYGKVNSNRNRVLWKSDEIAKSFYD